MWQTWLAAAMTMCWASAALAEKAVVELGVLTCTLGQATLVSDAVSGGQMRDAVCTFQSKSGAEETYAARVQIIAPSPDHNGALIWLVKRSLRADAEPGLLEQSYANDPTMPADQDPPLIGKTHPDVALHSMADKPEGNAGATKKPETVRLLIRGIELKLKSTSV
jgi:hypothetical protein